MSKFKVGDKIRSLEEDIDISIGDVLEVLYCAGSDVHFKDRGGDHRSRPINSYELVEESIEMVETAKYKFGDKVRIVGSNTDFYDGTEVLVLEDDTDALPLWIICGEGHSEWVRYEDVESIEDTSTEFLELYETPEAIPPMTMGQLTAFVHGYVSAGGDLDKTVTITFEGDN